MQARQRIGWCHGSGRASRKRLARIARTLGEGGMRVGIIGGTGWIGQALGRALLETGRVAPDDLAILNRTGTTGAYFGHAVQWAAHAADLVNRCDVIVVSVKPQDWPGLALQAQGRLVISVMAGVRLRALPPRSLRALPNAAAELRRSYTPWFAGPDLTGADKQAAVTLLSAIGTCEELQTEDHLDLMTATTGAGPAYPALMAQAIIGYLVENGVTPGIAPNAAEAVLCGATPLRAGKMGDAANLVQRFIDHDGTTVAGLRMAIAQGFETALKAGLAAAAARARAMSEGT